MVDLNYNLINTEVCRDRKNCSKHNYYICLKWILAIFLKIGHVCSEFLNKNTFLVDFFLRG